MNTLCIIHICIIYICICQKYSISAEVPLKMIRIASQKRTYQKMWAKRSCKQKTGQSITALIASHTAIHSLDCGSRAVILFRPPSKIAKQPGDSISIHSKILHQKDGKGVIFFYIYKYLTQRVGSG